MDPPHRRGLRVAQKSPDWQPPLPATLIVRFDSERQKFTSAMQSPGAEAPVVESIVPLMVTSVGERAEAGDLGVVADLEVERIGGGAVGAGLEEQRVALRPDLVRDLLGRRSRRRSPGSGSSTCSGRRSSRSGRSPERWQRRSRRDAKRPRRRSSQMRSPRRRSRQATERDAKSRGTSFSRWTTTRP